MKFLKTAKVTPGAKVTPIYGIYLTLSEHFSQFASINHAKIDIKKIVMFGRDTSKFNEESYRNEIKSRLNPWITTDIRKLISIRDRLFARKKGNQII